LELLNLSSLIAGILTFILVSFAMLYFILDLTGYIRRLHDSILGIQVKVFVIISVIVGIVVPLLLILTDILVTGFSERESAGFDAVWSPWMVPVEVFTILYITFIIVLVFKSCRERIFENVLKIRLKWGNMG
jgi:hypothetical protein